MTPFLNLALYICKIFSSLSLAKSKHPFLASFFVMSLLYYDPLKFHWRDIWFLSSRLYNQVCQKNIDLTLNSCSLGQKISPLVIYLNITKWQNNFVARSLWNENLKYCLVERLEYRSDVDPNLGFNDIVVALNFTQN
jgi:hypothetical protein